MRNPLDITYIHFGHPYFNNSLFVAPTTDNQWQFISNKPLDGLWASPMYVDIDGNPTSQWKEWCSISGFTKCDLEHFFTFKLLQSTKLLLIDSLEDVNRVSVLKDVIPHTPPQLCLDFNIIFNEYDAMFVTENIIHSSPCPMRKSPYAVDKVELIANRFVTYDVESICVFNPNVLLLD